MKQIVPVWNQLYNTLVQWSKIIQSWDDTSLQPSLGIAYSNNL